MLNEARRFVERYTEIKTKEAIERVESEMSAVNVGMGIMKTLNWWSNKLIVGLIGETGDEVNHMNTLVE